MRTHHHVAWAGDVSASTIGFAAAVGLVFYGAALALAFADRIRVPPIVAAVHATALDRTVVIPLSAPESPEEVVDARPTVDSWSCRPGC